MHTRNFLTILDASFVDRKKNVITCCCPISQIPYGALPVSRTFAGGSTYIETSTNYLLSFSLFIPIAKKNERERAMDPTRNKSETDDSFLV
jgi:hypothetical protein